MSAILLLCSMRTDSSATTPRSVAVSGLSWAALGVLVFSFTFPATHAALSGFDPIVVGVGRSVIAGTAAAVTLLATRVSLPDRSTWAGLLVVGLGCGFGFGLFTSVALTQASVSHVAVVVALLPLATSVVAVLRGGERPGRWVWGASVAGSLAVLALALARGGGRPEPADVLLLMALVAAAVGYAEGGRLARTMPGWQVISWGLVVVLPLTVPVSVVALLHAGTHQAPDRTAWLGYAYVAFASMFLGFFAWYRGMAEIGIARASQVQLAQPLLTLTWSALFLDETLTPPTLLVAVFVLACVVAAQRTRGRGGTAEPIEAPTTLVTASRPLT